MQLLATLTAVPAPLVCGDVSALNAAPQDAGQSTKTAIGVVLGLMVVAGFGVWVETGRRKRKAESSKKDLELSLMDDSRNSARADRRTGK